MSELRVNTISEETSANGVSIDGVTLKDNGITISQDISHLDNAGNSRILYDRSENLLGNTGTNLQGATLFIGGTGSANQLDDYEEGTWTPSGPSLGVATTHKAIYRKIGDIVVVYCDIEYNSSPSDVAQATSLSGLPFSSNDSYFQQNTRVATRNQNIRAEVSGSGVGFTDVADGVTMIRSEFAGNRTQHMFIYTTA